MAIKPPKHQGEEAELRDEGIVTGLDCDGEKDGSEICELCRNCGGSTIQSQTVHECGLRQP